MLSSPPRPPVRAAPLRLTAQTALLGKPGWASWLPVPFLSHGADDAPDIAVELGLQKKGEFSQTEECILEKMGKRVKTRLVQGKAMREHRELREDRGHFHEVVGSTGPWSGGRGS